MPIENTSVRRNYGGLEDVNMNEIVNFLWGAKEILRGDYKKNRWGEIILPFVVLRRLEMVLEYTKDKVMKSTKKWTSAFLMLG
jgi:type I restriction-modification system DNA methylase subunit